MNLGFSRVARRVSRVAVVLASALATSAGAQSLKHEKYALPNGMTVILHEDHTLPVATVNIWYRVGAKNEPKGRSGFAHLFEHLMFMGTKRVPDNQFDVLMETGGGANNASTSLDRTNYYSWGPSSLLPTLLWLDADRLEDMGREMTPDKVDKQRDVVRNERRQTTENVPYGKADDAQYQWMFPESHPYHNGVIGTHQDLEAANSQNVKDFFATFYAPGNASLVVAGDFDSKAIKPLIEKLYADLPRGNTPKDRAVEPARLDRVIRDTVLDKVQLPRISFVYHSPAAYKDGDAEMTLAASILAQGQSSRLYKRLVLGEQIAVDVSAFQDANLLGSLFRVDVSAKPGADLARIEAIVDEEMARFCKEGPTADELAERKASTEFRMLSAMQSVQARADRLNEYEFYFGEPDALQRDLDRYRKATPQTVASWSTKVITPNARLVQIVLPESGARAANGRDGRPADFKPAGFTPPAPTKFTLSNGLKVELWQRPDLPLVTAAVVFHDGKMLDPADRAGRASIVAEMLGEGTTSEATGDGPKFAAAMQKLGASFNANVSKESLIVSVSGLTSTFEQSSKLWADAIMHPKFEPKDFERVTKLRIEDLKQADEEPGQVAGKVGQKLLFGDTAAMGTPADGTVASIGTLSHADLASVHGAVVRPDLATLFIAGDLSADKAKAILEKHFAGWKAGSIGGGFTAIDLPKDAAMRVAIVDRPGAPQTMIRFLAPSVAASDPSRVGLRLMSTILGGSFTSRLNQNLRERNGYTYGARCSFTHTAQTGWFGAGAAVQSEVTGKALKEFLNEFNAIRSNTITAAELTKARETLRTEAARQFSTLGGFVSAAESLLEDGMGWDSIAKDMDAMEKVSLDQLNELASRALRLDKGVLVLVGDKKLIEEQIKDLGLPAPTEVDVEGRPVK
ncbi:MAG: insulinase family protein [Phycisphaerales bacterium]|nr:insulinase family protein [Phycisphaerales bacterium]